MTSRSTPLTAPSTVGYARSQDLLARAKRTAPGGVHSSFRVKGSPSPLFYTHGKGSHLWDADGNEYIDFAMAFGPLILGHSHPAVNEAVRNSLDAGQLYAGQHEDEVLLAELMVEALPNADQVRFGQSGTEMDQLALRLARSVTGRRRVVRFIGHYHGWLDPLFVDPAVDPFPSQNPALTAGQSAASAQDVIMIPWNDIDAVRGVFAEADDIAAVFMEPILSNIGMIMPREGFIDEVRGLCEANGALLVLDEVITGFRVAMGGAQEFLSTSAHLSVYAKAMASGYPVAALAGSEEIMSGLTAPNFMHGGTYNTGRTTMAAAVATMQVLRDENPYPRMHELGGTLITGIRELATAHDVDLVVEGIGPVFQTRFGPEGGVFDRRSYIERADAAMADRFLWALQDRGVRLTHRGTWFFSAAHTDEDVQRTLEAVDGALGEITR